MLLLLLLPLMLELLRDLRFWDERCGAVVTGGTAAAWNRPPINPGRPSIASSTANVASSVRGTLRKWLKMAATEYNH